MQYLEEHNAADPDVTRRAKDLLKKGYARLTGYECKQQGYEWFGGDPGHEALTAYGLMQFRDMQQGLRGRSGDGPADGRVALGPPRRQGRLPAESQGARQLRPGPGRRDRRLHHLGADRVGPEGHRGRSDARRRSWPRSPTIPTCVALAAATAINADKKDDGRKLLDKLAKAQADDGHLEGKQGSITRSGGQSLQVETTALAALAWLKMPDFTAAGQQGHRVDRREPAGRRRIRLDPGDDPRPEGPGAARQSQPPNAQRRQAASSSATARPSASTRSPPACSETIAIDGLEANLKAGRQPADDQPDRQQQDALRAERQLPHAASPRAATSAPCG